MNKEKTNIENMNNENMNMQSMTMSQQRRGNKRRVLLLIILLICTVALLGGATYAWFTANTSVKIQDLTLRVSTANGIQISSDAKAWGVTMSLEDLYLAGGFSVNNKSSKAVDAGAINMLPGSLYNVSSVGNVYKNQENSVDTNKNGKLELFFGVASQMCYVEDGSGGGTYKVVESSATKSDTNIQTVTVDKCSDKGPLPNAQGLVKTETYTEGTKSCAGGGMLGEISKISTTGYQCGEETKVVAFDTYLKLDAASTVYLAAGSYVKANQNLEDLGLKNTVRVAFVVQGTQPSVFYDADPTTSDVTTGGKLSSKATGKFTDTVNNGSASADDIAYAQYMLDYVNNFGGYVGPYGARTMSSFGSILIWEPNASYHTTAALQNAELNYNKSVTNEDTTYGIWANPSTSATFNYQVGSNAPITLSEMPMFMYLTNSEEFPEYFAEQKTVTASDVTTPVNSKYHTGTSVTPYKNEISYLQTAGNLVDTSYKLFTAPAGVTKLRIYMWIEGNDIDTENKATSSAADVSLMFTTAGAGEGETEDNTVSKWITYSSDYTSKSGDNYIWRTTPALGATAQQKTTYSGTGGTGGTGGTSGTGSSSGSSGSSGSGGSSGA